MEEYRIVKDYPNYEISNHGNVRNILTGRALKTWLNKVGYFDVELYKKNIRKHKSIHKLLAETFLENPEHKNCVDHIDGNKTNNGLENLRFATNSENGMNKIMQCNNVSGCIGIYWYSKRNKWCAEINVNKQRKHLGYFTNKEDAIKARKDAQDKYFGEYQRFNSEFERLQFQCKKLMKEFNQLLIEIEEFDPMIIN